MKTIKVYELNANDIVVSENERWVVKRVRQIDDMGYQVDFHGGWYTQYSVFCDIVIES